jgi:hypothetical protein
MENSERLFRVLHFTLSSNQLFTAGLSLCASVPLSLKKISPKTSPTPITILYLNLSEMNQQTGINIPAKEFPIGRDLAANFCWILSCIHYLCPPFFTGLISRGTFFHDQFNVTASFTMLGKSTDFFDHFLCIDDIEVRTLKNRF